MRCHLRLRLLFLPIFCFTLMMGMEGCSKAESSNTPYNAPQSENSFGPATNHVHSFLAITSTVFILATHDGTYRTQDAGKTWKQVTGGTGQLMQGLMNYSLTSSPLDSHRLYLLTEPAINQPQGIPGLYTSIDQGETWQMSASNTSFASGNVFFAVAGNDTREEVYLYFPNQGLDGLKVSQDAGQHFITTGPLPFSNLMGLLAVPGAPGHLLIYGDNGIARSTDGGKHWHIVKGVHGDFINLISAGPEQPIYADGDEGLFSSTNDGLTFHNINLDISYSALCISRGSTHILYGKTGTSIYRSTDGGQNWKALPRLQQNLANFFVDPQNAQQIYLATSYPTQVYHFDQPQTRWIPLMQQ